MFGRDELPLVLVAATQRGPTELLRAMITPSP